jgi:hypothetical protein
VGSEGFARQGVQRIPSMYLGSFLSKALDGKTKRLTFDQEDKQQGAHARKSGMTFGQRAPCESRHDVHNQPWPTFIFSPSFVYVGLGHVLEGILEKMDKRSCEYDTCNAVSKRLANYTPIAPVPKYFPTKNTTLGVRKYDDRLATTGKVAAPGDV